MKRRFNTFFCGAIVFSLAFVIVVLVIGVTGRVSYGSYYAIPAIMNGMTVLAEPTNVSVGEVRIGDSGKEVYFNLTNLSTGNVRVNGMRSSCSCVTVQELPMDIPPRSSRSLAVRVRPVEGQAGRAFSQTVELFLSVAQQRISLTVQGRVAQSSNSF